MSLRDTTERLRTVEQSLNERQKRLAAQLALSQI